MAHNATLTALISRKYRFDLAEVERRVETPYIETLIRNSAAEGDRKGEKIRDCTALQLTGKNR